VLCARAAEFGIVLALLNANQHAGDLTAYQVMAGSHCAVEIGEQTFQSNTNSDLTIDTTTRTINGQVLLLYPHGFVLIDWNADRLHKTRLRAAGRPSTS